MLLRAVLFLVVISIGASGCSSLFPVSDMDRYNQVAGAPEIKAKLFMPMHRMKALPEPVLQVNGYVAKEIRHFTTQDRRFIPISMGRYEEHGVLIRQILEDEGVPPALAGVALIESGFNSEARSRSGAVGMWQFMKGTARVYGLNVGLFEDQRKDVVLSTIAAARHLRDLYIAYNDWNLALAAYNAGSAAVDRAIQKGGTRDFWELVRKRSFRTETNRYVPKFIAVATILRDPARYGFSAEIAHPPVVTAKNEERISGVGLEENGIQSWSGDRHS